MSTDSALQFLDGIKAFEALLQYGAIGAISTVCIVLLVKMAKWFGEHLIVPLRDRAIKHVDTLDQSVERLNSSMEAISTSVETVSHAVEAINRNSEVTTAAIRGIHERLDKQGDQLFALRTELHSHLEEQNERDHECPVHAGDL